MVLESLKRQVNISNSATGGSAVSMGLISSSAASSGAYVSSTSANGSSTVHNPLNTSDQGLVQRQKEVMKMQDDMILDIEKGVDKLHQTVRFVLQATFAFED